jgi:cytoplasmic iron level regulating protein YaaA (DUF328/UPF0246 family)
VQSNVVVIPCSGPKLPYPAPARDIYAGLFFRKALALADRCDADLYIFSAKYGLLHPDTVIAPYELALRHNGNMKLAHKRGKSLPPLACPEAVTALKQAANVILQPYSKRVYLMSKKYCAQLVPGDQPLFNLRFGEQIQWLGAATPQDLGLEEKQNAG